jgi:hypothetical protein
MGNALGTASNRAKTYQGQVQKAGMHTTNLTWQLNDIGVMLASGQNPFMLAMQQGTQITQIFSQMGGTGKQAFAGIVAAAKSMITPLNVMTIGAIAGGAALLYWARSAINGGEEAMTLEDRIEDLSSTLKEWGDDLDKMADNSALADRFGKDAEAARQFLSEISSITSGELQRSFTTALGDLNDPFGLENTMKGLQLGSVADQLGLDRAFFVFTDNAREAREVVDGIAQAGINVANGLNSALATGSFAAQREAAENLLATYTELADANGVRTASENEYIRKLTDVVTLMQEFRASTEELSVANRTFVDQMEKSLDVAEDRLESELEMTTDMQQRSRLQNALNNLGSESLGYLREQAAVERQIFATLLDQQGTKGVQKADLLAQFDALKAIEETTFNIAAAKAASDTAAKELTEIMGISAELKGQIDLQRTLNTYGEESLQYRQASLQASQDALEAELDLVNATQTQKDAILALNATWWMMSNPIEQATERTRGLTSMISGANSMAIALVRNLGMVPTAMAGLGNDVVAQISAMRQANASLTDQIQNGSDARVAAVRAERDAILNRMEIDGVDMVAQTARIATMDREIETLEGLATQNNALAGTLDDMNSSTKDAAGGTAALSDAAKDATKSLEELETSMRRALEDARTPLEVFNEGLAELALLADYAASKGVDFGQAYSVALRELQQELGNSVPMVGELSDAFGDWVAGGFNDFDDMLRNMLNSFKSTISQMVSTAVSNPIKLTLTGAGGSAGALAGGGGGGGGGGILGNIGMGGGILGSFMSGGAGLVTSMMGGGGLASAGTYMSAVLGGATSSLAGFAAAAGAIALPLLAVAAVFSFFQKKTKQLDAGIRLTVDGMDTLVETFNKTETKKFWGLSKKTSTDFDPAEASLADPLTLIVNEIQKSVLNMAGVLGVGADAYEDFTHQIKLSTKGMSDEEAQQAVSEALQGVGDAFAGMTPDLGRFTREGETFSGTLTRIVGDLGAVNLIMDTLSHTLQDASVIGAGTASDFVAMFGGIQAMNTATTEFFMGFYSDAERFATASRQIEAQFAALNVSMPRSRTEFRAMVDALDLNTLSGRQMYASLVSMSGALNNVLPLVADFTAAMETMVGSITTEIDVMIGNTSSSMRANEQAAALWYNTATTLREFIADLRGTSSELTSATQARAFAETRFQALLAATLAGDNEAASNLSGAASTLLSNTRATANTALEVARAEARILSDLQLASGVSDIEGARHDAVAGLLGQQVELLNTVRDAINNGDPISPTDIDGLNAQLGALEAAIAEAEMINYAFLKERMNVAVDLVADADIPAALRTMLDNAATGIVANITYIARAEGLTPDLRWLALTSSSQLIKTIDLVVGKELDANTSRIALNQVGSLTKTVNMIVGTTLSPIDKRIALAGSSELARVVNVTLDSGSNDNAMRLALGNLGTYAVAVQASLSASEDVRQIVFGDAGPYAAMVEASFSGLSNHAQRVLLEQQGDYSVRVLGVLFSGISAPLKALMLNANTTAIRNVTVAAVLPNSMTDEQRELLLAQSQSLTKTINGILNLVGFGPDELAMLRSEDGVVNNKWLRGHLELIAMGPDELAMLRMQNQTRRKDIVGNVAFRDMQANDWKLFHMRYEKSGKDIVGNVAFRDMKANDWKLFHMRYEKSGKDILGNVAFRDMSVNDWALFHMENQEFYKSILGNVEFEGMNGETWKLFDMEDERYGKDIVGNVAFRGMSANDWKLFHMRYEKSGKDIIGNVGFRDMSRTDWDLFFMEDEDYVKTISGDVNTASITKKDQALLDMSNQLRVKTISGVVNLSSITAQQQKFLDAVSGSTSGQITLGGSFKFDPASGFSSWFSDTTKTNISNPMTALKESLTALSDTLHEQAGTTPENPDAARWQNLLGLATSERGDTMAQANRVIGNIETLERNTGVSLRNGSEDARLGLNANGGIDYKATSFAYSAGSDIDAFRDAFYGPEGLEAQLNAIGQRPMWQQLRIEQLREQLRSVGAIPAYANGTDFHAGGIASVGENGQEYVDLPRGSRVHTAEASRAMGDNTRLELQVAELTAEVVKMADVNKQLMVNGNRDLRKIRTIEETRQSEAVVV